MKMIRSLMMSALVASAMFAVSSFAEPVKQQDPAQKLAATQAAVMPNAALVNINSADAATLADRLNGVGIKKAEAIVSFREQNGPFKSIDDLVNVAGIGAATLEKNRSLISLN
jgi:competence protein ComEA